MRVYIFIAAIAGGVTWLIMPLVRFIAIKAGTAGEVRSRDIHTTPTPRLGGVGMLIGFIVALMVASKTPWLEGLFAESSQLWVILIGAIAVCLLGVVDDIWDLDWMLKLAGQILIAVFVSWQGVQIISLPTGSGLVAASPSLSMAVTAILIVASINAVNFVDGLDGLAAGIVAIGGIAFAFYSYYLARTQPSYSSMATLVDVALVGICVGFLLHNWHPAKLFMGDSGSMLIGYLLTCASIVITGRFDPATMHSGAYLPVFLPILLPIFVLFIPVLDMVMAIIRRLAHGHSPAHPDRMHLHHRMIAIGHSVRSAVLIMWGWAFFIAFASVMTLFVPLVDVIIGAVIVVPILTILTLAPHYSKRAREIRAQKMSAQKAVGIPSRHTSDDDSIDFQDIDRDVDMDVDMTGKQE
jgi:UDP-GlcNAc:undecaprenyl-phosphate GlcNAc-1-phosphate transferase